jgi:uncharacterized membrane protein
MVNTFVLAYAGASQPLLILFTVSGRDLTQVLNTELVAEEVARTLVGSIGLVASVPITTELVAFVVTKVGGGTSDKDAEGTRAPRAGARVPPARAEREWHEES